MNQFNAALNRFLQDAFGINPGERKRALLMQANIFLIITTLLIVKPTVNALFLSKFGVERLPLAFIFVAIAAAVVSSLYSKQIEKYPLRKIFYRTTLFSVISLLGFGTFLNFGVFVGPLLFLFYIWVAIFALLSTSQFWVLANLIFNAREAKRLFGFIGAGAIAGGIFGGYLTSILAGLLSSENLSFVAAGMLAICLPISKKVWQIHTPSQSKPIKKNNKQSDLQAHPFRLILQSEHLMYIAGIVGVSVVVAKLVDYQFSGIASMLVPDPDELTSFLGFWFSTFNLVSLLLQLFLTRRIVGEYGVGTSLFFLPGLILIATIVMFIMPEVLLAAVFLKMADGSLKQSINKAAIELIIMPINTEVKNRTKTFIDVFIDSLATGISGLLLLGIIEGLELSMRSVSILILLFIGVWIYLAHKVQKEYIRSFKIKLEESFQENRIIKNRFNIRGPSAIAGFRRILEQDNGERLIFALRKIRKIGRKDFVKEMLPLLRHHSAEVRAETISTLYHFRSEEVVSEIIPLTEDPDPNVKANAYEYLLAHSTNGNFSIIREYLNDPDPWTQNAALVTLAREHRQKPRRKNAAILEEMIRQKISRTTITEVPGSSMDKITLAKTIGFSKLNVLHEHLFKFLNDSDEEVVKQAILASGDTLDTIFIERLVRFFADKNFRPNAQQAIATFGRVAVPELRQLLLMPGFPNAALEQLPACLRLIPSQPTVNLLFELLDHENVSIRRDALRSLNSLKSDYPELEFGNKEIVRRILFETKLYQKTISALFVEKKKLEEGPPSSREMKIEAARHNLIRLLNQRLDRNLERIFRLLGLKYQSKDILVIYHGLSSNKEERRANALEFLENLLEPNLRKIIIPIIESTMLETISGRAIRKLNARVPNEYQCFRQLLGSKDIRMKMAVLHLIRHLDDEKYLSLVEECTKVGRPKFRQFAEGVLEDMTKSAQGNSY